MPEPLNLIEANFVGIPLTTNDALHSLLVEHPDNYYLVPSRRLVFFVTRERGLLMYRHDFRQMSDDEVADHLFYLKRSL